MGIGEIGPTGHVSVCHNTIYGPGESEGVPFTDFTEETRRLFSDDDVKEAKELGLHSFRVFRVLFGSTYSTVTFVTGFDTAAIEHQFIFVHGLGVDSQIGVALSEQGTLLGQPAEYFTAILGDLVTGVDKTPILSSLIGFSRGFFARPRVYDSLYGIQRFVRRLTIKLGVERGNGIVWRTNYNLSEFLKLLTDKVPAWAGKLVHALEDVRYCISA